MWNKLIIVLILIVGINKKNQAQDFLNKSRRDILRYIESNKVNQLDCKLVSDSIVYTISEEDERNRRFEVVFCFLVSGNPDSLCKYYERRVPVHEYYANAILDQVSLKKATGNNVMLNVDGVKLNSKYDFGDYLLDLKLKQNHLILSFSLKPE